MKSIFEQSGGTYTMQGAYRLPDVTLLPEEERRSACGDSVGCDIRNNIIRCFITICSLPASSIPTLQIPKSKHMNLSLAGESIRRERRCYRTTQSHRATEVSTADEQYSKSICTNCKI